MRIYKKCIAPGDVFRMLTILRDAVERRTKNDHEAIWECRCSCGGTRFVRTRHLKSGVAGSCGCDKANPTGTPRGSSKLAEYYIWYNMINRCRDPKHKTYAYYGGRGIKFTHKWLDFAKFLRDMGLRPSKLHSLDRIDNAGHYCKENCKWATRKEQSRNRRNTLFVQHCGRDVRLIDYCELLKLNYPMMRHRLLSGMTLEEATNKPYRHAAVKIDGVEAVTPEMCALRGMDYNIVSQRIRVGGWTVERALNTPIKHHRSKNKPNL